MYTHIHTCTQTHTDAQTHTHTDSDTHICHCFQPASMEEVKAWHLQSCSSSVHRWKVMCGLGRGTLGGRSGRGSPEGRSRLWRPWRRRLLDSPLHSPPHPTLPLAPVWGLEGVAKTLTLLYLFLLSSFPSLPLSAHPGPNTAVVPSAQECLEAPCFLQTF